VWSDWPMTAQVPDKASLSTKSQVIQIRHKTVNHRETRDKERKQENKRTIE
jgi:hypothetical protein